VWNPPGTGYGFGSTNGNDDEDYDEETGNSVYKATPGASVRAEKALKAAAKRVSHTDGTLEVLAKALGPVRGACGAFVPLAHPALPALVADSCLVPLLCALLREGEELATGSGTLFRRAVRAVRLLALTPDVHAVLARTPLLAVMREQVRWGCARGVLRAGGAAREV
jgi:hypothetical protein